MEEDGACETYHGDNLGLHLPHTGEDIRVQRVADGKHAIRLTLQIQHLLPAMVDRSRDLTLLPLCVIKLTQSITVSYA